MNKLSDIIKEHTEDLDRIKGVYQTKAERALFCLMKHPNWVGEESIEETVIDLVTDLMHLSGAYKINAEKVLLCALNHYKVEKECGE